MTHTRRTLQKIERPSFYAGTRHHNSAFNTYSIERRMTQKGSLRCNIMLCAMFYLVFNLCVCVQGQQDDCVRTNIQDPSECMQGSMYYNSTLQCCQACSSCPSGMVARRECNATHDTYCVPRCKHRCLYYDEREMNCILNCDCCPNQRCAVNDPSRCECDSSCYLDSDLYCDDRVLCPTGTPSNPTVIAEATPSTNNALPPWGIGLVAIGVVIGIVAFSACFLLMGFVTTTRKGDLEIHGSENSESGLVPSGGGSGGRVPSSLDTHSTYMSATNAHMFLSNQKILELLRNSNANSNSSLSSVRSSPRSLRSMESSPRPVRTVHVTMKNKSNVESV